MQVFMKQYGKAVLAAVAALLVMGILNGIHIDGNTGFIQIAYAKVSAGQQQTDTSLYTDAAAVKASAARSRPEIAFTYKKTLFKTSVNLNAMFSAEDADGNPASVEITDILDSEGSSILYLTKEDRKQKKRTYDTEEFIFPHTGIYLMKVKAVDGENKTRLGQYQIPVTSR